MLTFYSTKNRSLKASLKEAVLQGLAPDGGLFMPETISQLEKSFFDKISQFTFHEMALEIAVALFQNTIPKNDLKKIIEEAITFGAPLVALSENLHTLELFHGPTLSFKDFGASFLAQLMAYLNRNENRELHILAATSGDTGSAVAHGFLNVPGIKVWILYPKGQVSLIQEKQLTTMGQNVTALEVEGSFDDCQALVKRAFNDPQLNKKIRITSANSINIGRLFPQTFYYFNAFRQLTKKDSPILVSVPSGNFGNLTAGLIAKRMGLPIARFIASTNVNDVVPKYLNSGYFSPQPSKQTISNAMDVGNPSNFARILDLYESDWAHIRKDIVGFSFSDDQTREAIKEIDKHYHYIADPHGAVGYLGLKSFMKENDQGIFLETAHPAKFLDSVEPVLNRKIPIPARLQSALDKKKTTTLLPNNYDHFISLF